MSTGFWIGGLLTLVSSLPALWQVLLPGTGERTRLLARLIPRFSHVAIVSVVLLALTGTIQAVLQVGSLDALFHTLYGQALCLKIVLFIALLALGTYSLLRVTPRMQGFVRNLDEEHGARSLVAGTLQRTFRRAIRIELALMLLLLLVVGGLTSLSPPPQKSISTLGKGAFAQQGQVSTLRYQLVINPGTVGVNTIEAQLRDQNGNPITHADAVIVRFTMLDMSMGVQDVSLRAVTGSPGLYSNTASVISMSGHWSIMLLVRRTGFEDVAIPFPYLAP